MESFAKARNNGESTNSKWIGQIEYDGRSATQTGQQYVAEHRPVENIGHYAEPAGIGDTE